MTAYAYSDTDDVTEKADIDRAAVERLERDPYGNIAMTDEERKKLVAELRATGFRWFHNVADEIERLNLELRHERDVRAEAERGCVNMAKEIERLAEELQYQYACDKAQQEEIKRLSALAQSDAEPVAWRWRYKGPWPWTFIDDKFSVQRLASHNEIEVEPLYTAPPRPDASAGLMEAADMAEKEAPEWPINNGTVALQQFARKLRAAAKSTPTWTGKGPMPDDVQGWPDRSASTDEADADKPLGFRTNDVPNPYAEGPYTAPPPKPKPVYCLGWNTINYVREHGTLETENIAFIAASDLLHDPRPDASAGLIEAANALSFAATCLEDAQQPNAAEYCRRAEARARAADRSGK